MFSKDDQSDLDPRELCCPLPFVELMALEPLNDSHQPSNATVDDPERAYRFRSRAVPFSPGDGFMAFGGHVYAQSAYAASKTVDKGFTIHVSQKNPSVSSFFKSYHLQLAEHDRYIHAPGTS